MTTQRSKRPDGPGYDESVPVTTDEVRSRQIKVRLKMNEVRNRRNDENAAIDWNDGGRRLSGQVTRLRQWQGEQRKDTPERQPCACLGRSEGDGTTQHKCFKNYTPTCVTSCR